MQLILDDPEPFHPWSDSIQDQSKLFLTYAGYIFKPIILKPISNLC